MVYLCAKNCYILCSSFLHCTCEIIPYWAQALVQKMSFHACCSVSVPSLSMKVDAYNLSRACLHTWQRGYEHCKCTCQIPSPSCCTAMQVPCSLLGIASALLRHLHGWAMAQNCWGRHLEKYRTILNCSMCWGAIALHAQPHTGLYSRERTDQNSKCCMPTAAPAPYNLALYVVCMAGF